MKSSLCGPQLASDVLAASFRGMYGVSPHMFRAPGRVNVIGEHTDYNDGFVMPAAIELYTWIAAAKREDRLVEAYSANFDERIILSLDALTGPPRQPWKGRGTNYPEPILLSTEKCPSERDLVRPLPWRWQPRWRLLRFPELLCLART
jgi:galactokinase